MTVHYCILPRSTIHQMTEKNGLQYGAVKGAQMRALLGTLGTEQPSDGPRGGGPSDTAALDALLASPDKSAAAGPLLAEE
eukprot:COSAG06_NODE_2563_length_6662_cov_16.476459_1_plen_79_part_10